jgi:hypothetical protein
MGEANRVYRKLVRWPLGCESRHALLMLMLSLHAVMGAVAFADGLRRPFSTAHEAADFISHSAYSNLPLVAYRPDFLSCGVGAYLDRPMFFIEGHREGTFVVWDQTRATQPTFADGRIAVQFLREHANNALFLGPIATFPPFTAQGLVSVTPLASFNGDSISGEDLAVYLVSLSGVRESAGR